MATTVNKTVKSAGGDYSSLEAFNTGEVRDLVAADEIARAELFNFSDTTKVDFSSPAWTTDSIRNILLFTNERHSGTFTSGAYRLQPTLNDGEAALTLSGVIGILIDGLQVQTNNNVGTDAVKGIVYSPPGGNPSTNVRIERCIITNAAFNTEAHRGIDLVSGGTNTGIRVGNNIIYDYAQEDGVGEDSIGIRCDGAGDFIFMLYNNTLHNCRHGIEPVTSGTLIEAKNNVVQDSAIDGYVTGGTGAFSNTATHNVSDIASDAPGLNPITGNVTFTNEGSDDFSLAVGDTVAKNAGKGLGTDGLFSIIDDVIQNGRAGKGTAYDCGAFEFQEDRAATAVSTPAATSNPIIFHDPNVVTATSFSDQTGFEVTSVIDAKEYTLYKAADANDQYVQLDYGTSVTINCIGIASHNLGTIGADIQVETSNNAAFTSAVTEVLAVFSVADDKQIFRTVTTSTKRYVRFNFTNRPSAAIEIGVVMAGTKIIFPFAINDSNNWDGSASSQITQTPVNDSGQGLNSVVTYEKLNLRAQFKFLPISFIDGTNYTLFYDFWGKFKKNFFWVWNESRAINETHFVRLTGNYSRNNPYTVATTHRNLTLDMTGRRKI